MDLRLFNYGDGFELPKASEIEWAWGIVGPCKPYESKKTSKIDDIASIKECQNGAFLRKQAMSISFHGNELRMKCWALPPVNRGQSCD